MKLYYDDALQAAFMSQEFGVDFIYPEEDKKRGVIDSFRIQASISIDGADKLRYHLPHPLKMSFKRFVHLNSYDIFQPQIGDVIKIDYEGGYLHVHVIEIKKKKLKVAMSNSCMGIKAAIIINDEFMEIIQRQGTQFFTPKALDD